MNRRSFFVEFVGAAGIGKSHLAGRLLGELRARGLIAHNVDDGPVCPMLIRIACLPRATCSAAIAQPESLGGLIDGTRQLVRYVCARRRSRLEGGIHVTSEGLFHKLRAISRHSTQLSMGDIAMRLLRFMPPPDAVVILQASAATVFDRRSARARPGDDFCRRSVGRDVAMTEDVVRTVRLVQQRIAPRMQVKVMEVGGATESNDVSQLGAWIVSGQGW